MCLAIPMQVQSIDGFMARCEARGVERDVSLLMMQDDEVEVGDFVMVHLGYVTQKVSPQDAHTAWGYFDEILATLDGNPE